jgi:hypothetical protein
MNTLCLVYAADAGAASQFTNQPFTSFLTLGGLVYGTTPDGLYLIGGDDDAGEPICPVVEGPRTDGGDDAFKRARSASILGSGQDSLALSVRLGDGEWREALCTGRGSFSLRGGGPGREVQWRIEGDGGDFAVTGLDLELESLGRRGRR